MTHNNMFGIESTPYNPLEAIEQFILQKDWPSERLNNHELLVAIDGNWCNYQTTFSWDEKAGLLHLAFSFEVGLPRDVRDMASHGELVRLIMLTNEQLLVGHFDIWREEGAIVWRFGLPLRGLSFDALYLEGLIDIAVEACERYFPAFQYVLWGGENAQHMVHVSMFDTVGTA